MSRLTLRLPETLHRQLSDAAKSEGISLNQYIVYALTRQITTARMVRPATASEIAEQRAAYAVRHAPVRSHDAIQNSHAPEDERLKAAQQEEQDWALFSLASAMRGMEGENAPIYSLADLKVVFS